MATEWTFTKWPGRCVRCEEHTPPGRGFWLGKTSTDHYNCRGEKYRTFRDKVICDKCLAIAQHEEAVICGERTEQVSMGVQH